jgi:hypothetical protein
MQLLNRYICTISNNRLVVCYISLGEHIQCTFSSNNMSYDWFYDTDCFIFLNKNMYTIDTKGHKEYRVFSSYDEHRIIIFPPSRTKLKKMTRVCKLDFLGHV